MGEVVKEVAAVEAVPLSGDQVAFAPREDGEEEEPGVSGDRSSWLEEEEAMPSKCVCMHGGFGFFFEMERRMVDCDSELWPSSWISEKPRNRTDLLR